jgi:hypothetical protein
LDADHVVVLSLFKYNQLVLTWRARREADLHAAPLMLVSIFKSSNCTIYGLWISTNGSVYGTTSSKLFKMNCKLNMLCRFILPTILLDMGCHCPNNIANIKSNNYINSNRRPAATARFLRAGLVRKPHSAHHAKERPDPRFFFSTTRPAPRLYQEACLIEKMGHSWAIVSRYLRSILKWSWAE